MKAALDFKPDQGLFTALLSSGDHLSHDEPIKLAPLLLDSGVASGDAKWRILTLENKFEDIMKALSKSDRTWARLAQHELWRRMS